MRQISKRPKLKNSILVKLKNKSIEINANADKASAADRIYTSSRKAKWFQPIIDNLKDMSGRGECCMFCSSSEASQLDHFAPLSKFPEHSMTWENFVWSCGLCNHAKRNKFPLPPTQLINPIDDSVWSFIRIDQYGNVSATWDPETDDYNIRGMKTIEIIELARQALQERRLDRLLEIKRCINDSLTLFSQGKLKKSDLKSRYKEMIDSSMQPDVANYFLLGPGKLTNPFDKFLQAIK